MRVCILWHCSQFIALPAATPLNNFKLFAKNLAFSAHASLHDSCRRWRDPPALAKTLSDAYVFQYAMCQIHTYCRITIQSVYISNPSVILITFDHQNSVCKSEYWLLVFKNVYCSAVN